MQIKRNYLRWIDFTLNYIQNRNITMSNMCLSREAVVTMTFFGCNNRRMTSRTVVLRTSDSYE